MNIVRIIIGVLATGSAVLAQETARLLAPQITADLSDLLPTRETPPQTTCNLSVPTPSCANFEPAFMNPQKAMPHWGPESAAAQRVRDSRRP
jgi:hypothetical protein